MLYFSVGSLEFSFIYKYICIHTGIYLLYLFCRRETFHHTTIRLIKIETWQKRKLHPGSMWRKRTLQFLGRRTCSLLQSPTAPCVSFSASHSWTTPCILAFMETPLLFLLTFIVDISMPPSTSELQRLFSSFLEYTATLKHSITAYGRR